VGGSVIALDFWSHNQGHVFLNPRLLQSEQQLIHKAIAQQGVDHLLWFMSSGTEVSPQGTKLVALEKSAFLSGAQTVVESYQVTAQDRWLNPLPQFHVGGLAVSARCYLSGAKEYHYQAQWSAHDFCQSLIHHQATLTSLVPTQVYDLVQAGAQASPYLRAVFVGGGGLSAQLFQQARQLGWPLLSTYGMTETSAMVAGAGLDSLSSSKHVLYLTPLPRVQFVALQSGAIALNAPSLFKAYLFVGLNGKNQWVERPQPFILDDHIELQGSKIKVSGRESELVKILGESVNLTGLEWRLMDRWHRSLAIVAHPHPRKGFDLHLFVDTEPVPSLAEINSTLLPFERISQVHIVGTLPRTALGKIKRQELQSLIAD
jgi:o-succinylbenzoate---CoA ligase